MYARGTRQKDRAPGPTPAAPHSSSSTSLSTLVTRDHRGSHTHLHTSMMHTPLCSPTDQGTRAGLSRWGAVPSARLVVYQNFRRFPPTTVSDEMSRIHAMRSKAVVPHRSRDRLHWRRPNQPITGPPQATMSSQRRPPKCCPRSCVCAGWLKGY